MEPIEEVTLVIEIDEDLNSVVLGGHFGNYKEGAPKMVK
jgi:hypothetical protein